MADSDCATPELRAMRLRALGEARELKRTLEELVAAEDAGQVLTCPRQALDLLEELIAVLAPFHEPPRLHLVDPYADH